MPYLLLHSQHLLFLYSGRHPSFCIVHNTSKIPQKALPQYHYKRGTLRNQLNFLFLKLIFYLSLFRLVFIKKCLTLHHILDIISLFAGMAELADALDLGSSGRPCRFKSCCPYYLQGFQRFYHLLKSLFFTPFQ